tara:strand:+ start:319 stop:675 length:357 start_codon:yes stop_codon:yes gene_type:complete
MKFSHREINPDSGAIETWYWDEANESFHIRTTHDVGWVLDHNKRQQSASLDQRFGNEMLHHVAEIPNGVIIKLQREHNINLFEMSHDDERKLRRLLDDPEWKYLKTTVRKLSRTSGGV